MCRRCCIYAMLGYLMLMVLPTLMNLCGSFVSLGLTPAWLGCLYCTAAVQMGLWCECLLTLPHSGALCESPTPRVCLLSGAVRAQRDLAYSTRPIYWKTLSNPIALSSIQHLVVGVSIRATRVTSRTKLTIAFPMTSLALRLTRFWAMLSCLLTRNCL